MSWGMVVENYGSQEIRKHVTLCSNPPHESPPALEADRTTWNSTSVSQYREVRIRLWWPPTIDFMLALTLASALASALGFVKCGEEQGVSSYVGCTLKAKTSQMFSNASDQIETYALLEVMTKDLWPLSVGGVRISSLE